jgi:transcriptional regulator with XRE-family HTH domain
MDNIHARLARNLRALRQKTGLSQEAFADEAGLHRTYVSGLERGNRNPTISIIEKLTRALGVSAGKLLD